jgi:hypothetical protein
VVATPLVELCSPLPLPRGRSLIGRLREISRRFELHRRSLGLAARCVMARPQPVSQSRLVNAFQGARSRPQISLEVGLHGSGTPGERQPLAARELHRQAEGAPRIDQDLSFDHKVVAANQKLILSARERETAHSIQGEPNRPGVAPHTDSGLGKRTTLPQRNDLHRGFSRLELELDPFREASGDSNRFVLEAALDGGLSLGIAQDAFYDHHVLSCGNTAKVSLPRHHVLLKARRTARLRSRVIDGVARCVGRRRGFEASRELNAELSPTL